MKYLGIIFITFAALAASDYSLHSETNSGKKGLHGRSIANIKSKPKQDSSGIAKKTVTKLTKNAQKNSRTEVQNTQITQAAQTTQTSQDQSVTTFLQSQDILGRTPLLLALANKQSDIYTAILETGVDVNVADICGETPLHVATAWGLNDVVEKLITLGANVNAADKFGQTPLIIAIKTGNTQIIKILINANATVPAPLQGQLDKLIS